MPRNKISDVLELLCQDHSQRQIVKILKADEIYEVRSTILDVKRKIGRQRNSESKVQIFWTNPARTSSNIEQVIKKD